MKKTTKLLIAAVALFAATGVAIGVAVYYGITSAQLSNEDPLYWESEVRSIEARYGGAIPSVDIVFVGSSSIKKWASLAADMRPLTAVNHGFGGS